MPPTNPSKPVPKGTHDQVRALKELDCDNTDAKALKLVRHIIDLLPILFVFKLSCRIRLSRVVRRRSRPSGPRNERGIDSQGL